MARYRYQNPQRVVIHDPCGISLGKRIHFSGVPFYSENTHNQYGSLPVTAPQEFMSKIVFNNCTGELNFGGIPIEAHGEVSCGIPIKKITWHHITIENIKPTNSEEDFSITVHFNDTVINADGYENQMIIGDKTYVVRIIGGMIGFIQCIDEKLI